MVESYVDVGSNPTFGLAPLILWNGVIGNTRGFEPLILSSSLGSRTIYVSLAQQVEHLIEAQTA